MPQFLDDDEIGLIDESLRLLGDRSDRVVGYFYAAMFVEAPQLRSLFPAAMDTQRDRLFRALTGAVQQHGRTGAAGRAAHGARPGPPQVRRARRALRRPWAGP